MSRSFIKTVVVAVCMLLILTMMFGCSGNKQTNTNPGTGSSGTSSESSSDTGSTEPSMKPVDLKLAHFWPATHPVHTVLVTQWAEAVEEATGGLVKITTYPGQTLANANEVYESVASGIADVGVSVFSYNAGRFPVAECLEMPGIVFRSSKIASYVSRDLLASMQLAENQDTKIMMNFHSGSAHLFTKTPVRTLEDLKNMEIRTFGTPARAIEALGAIPVAMSQADAYEALARGVVKGNSAPVEVLKFFRQAEVTNYITYTPLIPNGHFFMAMNPDVWNSFPPDIQAAIEKVNDKIFEEIASVLWDMTEAEGLEFAYEYGLEEIWLSDEEFEKWRAKLTPILDEYADTLEGKGLPGRQIVDTIVELADKYTKMFGEK